MPIRESQYAMLKELLAKELEIREDSQTDDLIRSLRHIKRSKIIKKDEFLRICHWKSPRPLRDYEKNSESTIQSILAATLSTQSEKRRLELLTTLKGVSVPTASAILTLIDPLRYGVIDIRVWQLLFALKSVRSNPSGTGFAFRHWYHYLRKLRYWAKYFNTSTRLVELTLFKHHKKLQTGKLYKSPTKA